MAMIVRYNRRERLRMFFRHFIPDRIRFALNPSRDNFRELIWSYDRVLRKQIPDRLKKKVNNDNS